MGIIIGVALGTPKLKIFMSRMKPYLKGGVGFAFKFYSGMDVKRGPKWMVRIHREWIVYTLPKILYEEWRRKCRQ
ncbi:WecB/TagA/CpsF family glycosyltransferase [Bacteroides bouchesdurhonensis]|uniref:WecB/TagA/CpsF family glycosyltransferase n=1 Tax=Bacteroides bouchesdurhonensis TaxID=1841855 RepID=UPI0021CB2FB3|nr:WecB/TagA/CpsF family glycosyltransferase [Bacteroides bouchesdurhonensis]